MLCVIATVYTNSAYLYECIEQEWNGGGLGKQQEVQHIAGSLLGLDIGNIILIVIAI